MPKIFENIPNGVISGDHVDEVYRIARGHGFAIPAINTTSTSTVNACLAAANEARSPIIIQFSDGGSGFLAGKAIPSLSKPDPETKLNKAALGSISGALHVHNVAKYYNIPVILHTDHCPKEKTAWLDGLVAANERFFKKEGKPLFSSHMLDFSACPLAENISASVSYLKKLKKMGIHLEVEVGVTGGEEDGVKNSTPGEDGGINSALYSTKAEVWSMFSALMEELSKDGAKKEPSDGFSIAASFGNVHGVYAVKADLKPELLGEYNRDIIHRLKLKNGEKPVNWVFHGGSGSGLDKVRLAVSLGVVKMNVDTDTQWAYWDGVREFEKKNRSRLQGQVGVDGSSDAKDKTAPNKKFYDPRVWLFKAEQEMTKRVVQATKDLLSFGVLDK